MAAPEAPPTLLTMEGEPAVFCTAEYAINDPDQAAAALHDRFEPDPDGRIFIDWVEVDRQRWGRGTLEVYATRLRTQTNGEARLDRFKEVIEEVIEGAELLDETRPSDSTSMHCWPRRDALEAQVRRHERSWVDGSIPMFGGLTPRQALEDPTRRDQLPAFLGQMEA